MVDVVLVNENNTPVGLMDKLEAHRNPGKLHRAVSVVLYRVNSKLITQNSKQPQNLQSLKTKLNIEVLLQKRSGKKPLWPGYWANTVCTHPTPQENNLDCAVRRLKEEMGIEMKRGGLKELYSFDYQVDYTDDLSEHEYDTVVVGEYEGDFILNLDEAAEAKWVEWNELQKDLAEHEEKYAPWPKMIFSGSKLISYLQG